MPRLASITVYPVKSLDGLDLPESPLLSCGALANDRRWRLVDLEGRVVNAKRTPLVQRIRAEFDLAERLITLAREGSGPPASWETFPLSPGREGPCGWLSEALGMRVLLEERADGGFPDDRDAPGPTLISTASLAAVAGWFGLDLDEARRRFRMNLEIDECDPFWEDTLAVPAGQGGAGRAVSAEAAMAAGLPTDPYAALPPPVPRRCVIGGVSFEAVAVCRRCVVPSRSSRGGDPDRGRDADHRRDPAPGFREAFEARRRVTLRRDVDIAAWSHLYRLGITTRAHGPAHLVVGAELT